MADDSSEHPLDGIEAAELHQWFTQSRQQFVDCKRAVEEKLLEDIVKISSAAVLIVPGALSVATPQMSSAKGTFFILLGIVLLSLALVCSIVTRVLSAQAYGNYEAALARYYHRQSTQLEAPSLFILKAFMYGSVGLFMSGIVVFAFALWNSIG
jgi:hypothetical protein